MAVAVYTSLGTLKLGFERATDGLLIRIVVLIDDVRRSLAVEAEEAHDVMLGRSNVCYCGTCPSLSDILAREFCFYL